MDVSLRKIIQDWSKETNPAFISGKQFISKPSILTPECTNGYQWLALKKKIIKVNISDKIFYCVASKQASSNPTKSSHCKEFILGQYNPFERLMDFLNYSQSIRVIDFNEVDWELSTCNCEEWKKEYKCNHVIGLAYNLNKFEWPELDLEIEGTRPSGRPKKTTTALTRKNAESLLSKFFPRLYPDLSQAQTQDQTPAPAPTPAPIQIQSSAPVLARSSIQITQIPAPEPVEKPKRKITELNKERVLRPRK